VKIVQRSAGYSWYLKAAKHLYIGEQVIRQVQKSAKSIIGFRPIGSISATNSSVFCLIFKSTLVPAGGFSHSQTRNFEALT